MCFDTFKKIHWQNVSLSALIFAVIAFVLWQVSSLLSMSSYTDPDYLGVWSKLMMPEAGPPPWSFMVISFVFSFITGLVLASLWDALKNFLPKEFWAKVLTYVDIIAALMLVMFVLPMILMINFPMMLLFTMFITWIIIVFLGSLVFAKLLK